MPATTTTGDQAKKQQKDVEKFKTSGTKY